MQVVAGLQKATEGLQKAMAKGGVEEEDLLQHIRQNNPSLIAFHGVTDHSE